MSCKMVDAMIDTNSGTWMWHTLNAPYKVEAGPYTHPSISEHPVCRIMSEYRLKDLPEAHLRPLDGVLHVIRQRAAERAAARRR